MRARLVAQQQTSFVRRGLGPGLRRTAAFQRSMSCRAPAIAGRPSRSLQSSPNYHNVFGQQRSRHVHLESRPKRDRRVAERQAVHQCPLPWARHPRRRRPDILRTVAARSGRSAVILEKDIWVCWVLEALFSMPDPHPMAFKGGTSFSKGLPRHRPVFRRRGRHARLPGIRRRFRPLCRRRKPQPDSALQRTPQGPHRELHSRRRRARPRCLRQAPCGRRPARHPRWRRRREGANRVVACNAGVSPRRSSDICSSTRRAIPRQVSVSIAVRESSSWSRRATPLLVWSRSVTPSRWRAT